MLGKSGLGIGAECLCHFCDGGVFVVPEEVKGGAGFICQVLQGFFTKLLHREQGFLGGSDRGRNEELHNIKDRGF